MNECRKRDGCIFSKLAFCAASSSNDNCNDTLTKFDASVSSDEEVVNRRGGWSTFFFFFPDLLEAREGTAGERSRDDHLVERIKRE